MRILGLDPGLRNTGWGAIDVLGNRVVHVENGVCKSTGSDLSQRLLSLYEQLSQVLSRLKPETASVEQTFVNSNGAATLKLGQARAISLLVPALHGLDVAEYAPNTIKKVVVGVGHAQKEQVAHMVKMQFPGIVLNGPDATDALAIALCHAHHVKFSGRLEAAIAKAGG